MELDHERLGTYVKKHATADDPIIVGEIVRIDWDGNGDVPDEILIVLESHQFDEHDKSWTACVLDPTGKIREEWLYHSDEWL